MFERLTRAVVVLTALLTLIASSACDKDAKRADDTPMTPPTSTAQAAEPSISGDLMNTEPGPITGASAYQSAFQNYVYTIETIGVVNIEQVTLVDGRLTALYTYVDGGETRDVRSVLEKGSDGVYRGKCTTFVDGQRRFAVETALQFAEDGTASGHWAWSGKPTARDPNVTISKRL